MSNLERANSTNPHHEYRRSIQHWCPRYFAAFHWGCRPGWVQEYSPHLPIVLNAWQTNRNGERDLDRHRSSEQELEGHCSVRDTSDCSSANRYPWKGQCRCAG